MLHLYGGTHSCPRTLNQTIYLREIFTAPLSLKNLYAKGQIFSSSVPRVLEELVYSTKIPQNSSAIKNMGENLAVKFC